MKPWPEEARKMAMDEPRLSVVSRLRQFFERNPDEELPSFAVIAMKFGCARKTAVHAVYELQARGILESTHVIRRRDKGIARNES